MADEINKVVILGSGPAGYTAALYTARANLQPLLIEGNAPGGQLTITTEVENYPGFEHGIQGPEMMEVFRRQVERFGTRFMAGDVTGVKLGKRPFELDVEGEIVKAETLIVSTGASAKLLNIESEKRLMGYGVSACATCDGAFFKEKEALVVGGGDTAMEEATFLTRFCTKVTIVHRRDTLRASKIMQDRARKNPKIGFIWDSAIEEIFGDPKNGVTGARLKNLKTGATSEVKTDAVFVAIGHQPNTAIFKGQLEMDDVGYLKVRPGSTYTNIEGVFAAGDVADSVYRQAVTAAGTGCMAAIDAERWLESHSDHA
ncbi:MAG: thioredoxin-disulfide reductase [Candidatus Binatus sp.]|uniref:thioredoxin-disulfide reductase n=1 Tax=Candidatus Binatus sp. TaxID=2811406 RepID=UPI00271E4E9A|nr:thioredoxin-disulfide reductase [Candidatus Binatus sp.]MDO8433125.1 thioredoxin-disulfide reductase [Candidatus Binatus sp.]